MKKIKYILTSMIVLAISLQSCETDFDNPNAPVVEDVSGTTNGLFGLIVGLQFQYTIGGASGLYTKVTANGFTTGELQLLNAGNADLAALINGGTSVPPNNGVTTNLWTNLNLVRNNAQTVIDQSGNAANPSLQNAVKAYGHFYKALAIGTMSQFWENVIVESGKDQAFVTRNQGLQIAIENLNDAATLLSQSAVPPSLLAAVGAHIDLPNTVAALTARYQLMLGNTTAALTAANNVDLTKRSVFIFNNVTQNPIFRSSLITNNVFDVNPNFGLSGVLLPNPADARINFYITAQANNGKGFFTADQTSIPIYVPGEILLIKAEAYARGVNQLDLAVIELNKVLTKTSATDIFGLGANLPAYSGTVSETAVLEEIYKNRCIELFMSGMKLEDSRRFGRPAPGSANVERNRNFYPYPTIERDNNTSTPADPAL
jgi:hypothetical protein